LKYIPRHIPKHGRISDISCCGFVGPFKAALFSTVSVCLFAKLLPVVVFQKNLKAVMF